MKAKDRDEKVSKELEIAIESISEGDFRDLKKMMDEDVIQHGSWGKDWAVRLVFMMVK